MLIGVILFLFVIYSKGKTYFEQKKLVEEYTSLTFATDETIEESTDQIEPDNGDVIGILEIPKLKLEVPIAEGADEENIRFAVGHLPSSSSIHRLGEKDNNFAIAGHRSYTYGKFFNRLDELDEGNELTVFAQNKVFKYRVFDKKIVEPTNVEVVYPIEGKSVVTLITCHPPYSDKQRLIVTGELVSEEKLDGSELLERVK